MRSARNRQAAVRPLAGPQIRLRPGGHCPDRDPRGFPADLRRDAGQYLGQDDAGDFLRRIEVQYGKAGRTWVMDRGIPTEAVLTEMRAAKTPTHYLVGTPRAAQPVGARLPGEALGTGSR